MSSVSSEPVEHPETRTGWVLPVITLLGTVAAIVAAAIGSGAFGGTPIAEAAGGALSADATALAPAGPAFRIWSAIYLGLLAYAIWQLFGAARRSPRQAAIRPWALASILLNSVWIWTVQLGWLIASVAVIVALLAILIRILFLFGRPPVSGWLERLLSDVTFGLYFGWVLVATFANTWALLADAGVKFFTSIPGGVVGIVVAALICVTAAILDGGRIAPAAASAWGLAWIAVGRTQGQFESTTLVWVAAVAAVIVILAPLVVLARRRAR